MADLWNWWKSILPQSCNSWYICVCVYIYIYIYIHTHTHLSYIKCSNYNGRHEKSNHTRLPKLSCDELVQFLDGWPIHNSRYCKQTILHTRWSKVNYVFTKPLFNEDAARKGQFLRRGKLVWIQSFFFAYNCDLSKSREPSLPCSISVIFVSVWYTVCVSCFVVTVHFFILNMVCIQHLPWLVCLVLWHINPCRLFNAKSIFM